MTLFEAGSNEVADIWVSNPNNVPIGVTMDLVVGDVRSLPTRGSAVGTVAAKSTGQFSVTVPMPTVEGNYPVNFWLDFEKQGVKYAVSDIIQIFIFKQVGVTLSLDRSQPKVPPETVSFPYTLVNSNPVPVAISNLVVRAGNDLTTPRSFTILANGSISGLATLVLTTPPSGSEWPISITWDGLSTPLSFPPLPALLPPVLGATAPAGVYRPGEAAPIQWTVTNPNLTETLRIIQGLEFVFVGDDRSVLDYPTGAAGGGFEAGVWRGPELAPGVTLSGTVNIGIPDRGERVYAGRVVCVWRPQRDFDFQPSRGAGALMQGTLQTTSELLAPTVTVTI